MNQVNEFVRYWQDERKIEIPPHSKIQTERWLDKESQREIIEIFAYYQSYAKPNWFRFFQRSPLSIAGYPRRSLPGWMTKKLGGAFYLYVPRKWDYYKNQVVAVVEGIPDVLTWWQVGIPAIGTSNAWILSNSNFQAQLRQFIEYVQPKHVIIVPDGDELNIESPARDNVRFWYQHFRVLLKQWPFSFCDLRRLDNGGKIDSNDLWQDIGCDAEKFKSITRTLLTDNPIMPELKPKSNYVPRRLEQQSSDISKRFISIEDFLDQFIGRDSYIRTSTGWYRGFCPVKEHSREGKRKSPQQGACGFTVNNQGWIGWRCNAGCSWEQVFEIFHQRDSALRRADLQL